MTSNRSLSTDRLLLRPFVAEDAERMYEILDGHEILKYFPGSEPATLPMAQVMIDRAIAHWGIHGYGLWAVDASDGDQLMGRCGLQYLPETDEVEIDFLLERSRWGQGFATEAASASLAFGLERLGMTRIVGIVHPENAASRRVLEKIGMEYDVRTEYFGMVCDRYTVEVADPITL